MINSIVKTQNTCIYNFSVMDEVYHVSNTEKIIGEIYDYNKNTLVVFNYETRNYEYYKPNELFRDIDYLKYNK